MVVNLIMAIILGGLIGLEREMSKKPAGLRTNILIALGAAIFTIISGHIGGDPSRVVAAVVTGIGFLGAGSILHKDGGTSGLTTASGIWATSGIGIACGLGFYGLATVTTLLVLVVLLGLSPVEKFINKFRGKK